MKRDCDDSFDEVSESKKKRRRIKKISPSLPEKLSDRLSESDKSDEKFTESHRPKRVFAEASDNTRSPFPNPIPLSKSAITTESLIPNISQIENRISRETLGGTDGDSERDSSGEQTPFTRAANRCAIEAHSPLRQDVDSPILRRVDSPIVIKSRLEHEEESDYYDAESNNYDAESNNYESRSDPDSNFDQKSNPAEDQNSDYDSQNQLVPVASTSSSMNAKNPQRSHENENAETAMVVQELSPSAAIVPVATTPNNSLLPSGGYGGGYSSGERRLSNDTRLLPTGGNSLLPVSSCQYGQHIESYGQHMGPYGQGNYGGNYGQHMGSYRQYGNYYNQTNHPDIVLLHHGGNIVRFNPMNHKLEVSSAIEGSETLCPLCGQRTPGILSSNYIGRSYFEVLAAVFDHGQNATYGSCGSSSYSNKNIAAGGGNISNTNRNRNILVSDGDRIYTENMLGQDDLENVWITSSVTRRNNRQPPRNIRTSMTLSSGHSPAEESQSPEHISRRTNSSINKWDNGKEGMKSNSSGNLNVGRNLNDVKKLNTSSNNTSSNSLSGGIGYNNSRSNSSANLKNDENIGNIDENIGNIDENIGNNDDENIGNKKMQKVFASETELPSAILNDGYYARFFIELDCLGSGSFGHVFLCRHTIDEEVLGEFALKKVAVGDNRIWLRKIMKEVKLFQSLHHPNCVSYQFSWLENWAPNQFCPRVPFLFILMQYCNRGNLQELIEKSGGYIGFAERKPNNVYDDLKNPTERKNEFIQRRNIERMKNSTTETASKERSGVKEASSSSSNSRIALDTSSTITDHSSRIDSRIADSRIGRNFRKNSFTGEGLQESVVWILFKDVLSGLGYLHAHALLHKDLKCENVLLNVEPGMRLTALLSDFGTAEILGERDQIFRKEEEEYLRNNKMGSRNPYSKEAFSKRFSKDSVVGLNSENRENKTSLIKEAAIGSKEPATTHATSTTRREGFMDTTENTTREGWTGTVDYTENTKREGWTGTVDYTAPELLMSTDDEYSEKTDMWSSGILLYNIIFASLPFSTTGMPPESIRKNIIEHDEIRFPDQSGINHRINDNVDYGETKTVPPLIRGLMLALLNRDPTKRPSASEILNNPAFGVSSNFNKGVVGRYLM